MEMVNLSIFNFCLPNTSQHTYHPSSLLPVLPSHSRNIQTTYHLVFHLQGFLLPLLAHSHTSQCVALSLLHTQSTHLPSLTSKEFQEKITLTSIDVEGEEGCCFWYNDNDLFWGHSISVTSFDGITFSDLHAEILEVPAAVGDGGVKQLFQRVIDRPLPFELFTKALEQNVSVIPGMIFSPTRKYRNCIRISCGQPWTEEMGAGISVLAKLADELLAARQ